MKGPTTQNWEYIFYFVEYKNVCAAAVYCTIVRERIPIIPQPTLSANALTTFRKLSILTFWERYLNSPVTGEFPAQIASNTENVSIWWRHHEITLNYTHTLHGHFTGIKECGPTYHIDPRRTDNTTVAKSMAYKKTGSIFHGMHSWYYKPKETKWLDIRWDKAVKDNGNHNLALRTKSYFKTMTKLKFRMLQHMMNMTIVPFLSRNSTLLTKSAFKTQLK